MLRKRKDSQEVVPIESSRGLSRWDDMPDRQSCLRIAGLRHSDSLGSESLGENVIPYDLGLRTSNTALLLREWISVQPKSKKV